MKNTVFTFRPRASLTADHLADVLDMIAGQVREGYTSGDAHGAGWWEVEHLDESEDERDEDDLPQQYLLTLNDEPWVGDWLPALGLSVYPTRDAAEAKNRTHNGRFYLFVVRPQARDDVPGYLIINKE
ncbi:hypothetical protein KIKIMORA_04980 [Brevundimonas phage vB_BpoS-Kikimora]|uniref:Uncharacterized protein n=1 Tax=Brevundimonas phage vB_BpoS-Kikimora TaxID=2948601 RepID=A0A9E7MRN3_9CAUD|nr:hypothetical protein KIKIMORA_04980 [Brevundimonas phage vB_BpoS-Kikimora]